MRTFDDVLVVAAEDPMTTCVLLESAANLARANGATVTAIAVVDGSGMSGGVKKRKSMSRDALGAMVRARLVELAELTRNIDYRIDHEIVAGVPHAEVLERVAIFGHDLVLVGDAPVTAPRRRRPRFSTTAHLVRECPVPVWVHSSAATSSGPIAVAIGPLGGDAEVERLNVKLLEVAGSLARSNRSRLHVIHAWRFEGDSGLSSRRLSYPWAEIEALAKKVVTEARVELEWLIDRAGLKRAELSVHVRNGDPADVLAAAVQDVDPGVVVMGTMARTGLQGLLIGNTAERVMTQVGRTVVVVKPDGFATNLTPELAWHPTMLPY